MSDAAKARKAMLRKLRRAEQAELQEQRRLLPFVPTPEQLEAAKHGGAELTAAQEAEVTDLVARRATGYTGRAARPGDKRRLARGEQTEEERVAAEPEAAAKKSAKNRRGAVQHLHRMRLEQCHRRGRKHHHTRGRNSKADSYSPAD